MAAGFTPSRTLGPEQDARGTSSQLGRGGQDLLPSSESASPCVSSNPTYQLLAASGCSLTLGLVGSQVAPVAWMKRGFEIGPFTLAMGVAQSDLQQLLLLSLCVRLGSRLSPTAPDLGPSVHTLVLAWTDHISKAQSPWDTLALSSRPVGISSVAHQPLLACFH